MRITKNDGAVWIVTYVDRIDDNHNVYVNVFGANGEDVRRETATVPRILYGWDGMQEEPMTVAVDKPLEEAGCNIPLFPGQSLWVEVLDPDGGVSDRASNLKFYGIGSYIVHFERLD